MKRRQSDGRKMRLLPAAIRLAVLLFLLPHPAMAAGTGTGEWMREAGSRFWEITEEFLEFTGERLEEAGGLLQGWLSEDELTVDPDRYALSYFYGRMTEEEQEVYASLYEGLMAGEDKIYLKTGDTELLEKITAKVLFDHPEIFWFAGPSRYTVAVGRTLFRPAYLMEPEERQRQEEELRSAAGTFLADIGTEWSDYEKVQAVFRHVIDTVDYDLEAPDNQMVTSALVGRRSVCSGYAREVQYLLHRMGIPCIYVSGKIGEGSHAWNIVRCDGKWYQLDATFGDPSFGKNAREESIPGELRTSWSYLCCTDEEMYRDHTPDLAEELPVCDSADLNYCALRGTYYREYPSSLREDLARSIREGESCWQCQFAREEDYRSFLSDLEDSLFLNLLGEVLGPGSYRVYWIYNETMYTVGCWQGNPAE